MQSNKARIIIDSSIKPIKETLTTLLLDDQDLSIKTKRAHLTAIYFYLLTIEEFMNSTVEDRDPRFKEIKELLGDDISHHVNTPSETKKHWEKLDKLLG